MEDIDQKLNFQYNSTNNLNINKYYNNLDNNNKDNKTREYIYSYNIDKENNETNSSNRSFYLINEINDLKKKYLMLKEKLEIAKNQKEKDNKYIKDLEEQLIKKNQSEKRNDFNSKKNNIISNYEKDLIEDENKSNKSMLVDIFRNPNSNNERMRYSRSNFSDFSLFDNNSFNSFQNDTNTKNNNNQIENQKNIISLKKSNNINKKVPIPKNSRKSKTMKRNNSVILDKTNKSIIIENSQNNKLENLNIINNNINSNISNNKNKMNKLFTFKENIENENENDFQTPNDSNEIINTNKIIIIKNCNCIINLNPQNAGNNNYIQLFHDSNIKKNIIEKQDEKEGKEVRDKIMEERYLIIDQKQKPIFIKGKQILGMNLIPLKGENDEIIYDSKNKIFLYDLDWALHNQNELENIILDNGLPLVNENNIPILGLNNIPIIDQCGDFLLGEGPLTDKDNNYIKGIYGDVLRDKENKPIKVLISKKKEKEKNYNSNKENELFKTFNNFYNNKNSNKSQIKNKLTSNNPLIEIEIKPYTKLITNKNNKNNKIQVNNIKKYQRNKTPFNDINKFNFEQSLRNYNKKNITKNNKYHYKRNNSQN